MMNIQGKGLSILLTLAIWRKTPLSLKEKWEKEKKAKGNYGNLVTNLILSI